MAEHFPADERPSSPWVPILIGALAIFGAITLVQFVLGAIFGLVKLAIVVVVAFVVIRAVVAAKAG